MSNRNAVMVYLKTDIHDHWIYDVHLKELEALSRTLGYEIVETIIQVRDTPTSAYLIGKGKVKELSELVGLREIYAVFFYQDLSSKQKLNLKRMLSNSWEVEILDRHDLALKIFEQQAADKLSKVQIQLAALKNEFPFNKLLAATKYHEAGRTGVGRRGSGEYPFHSKIKSLNKRIARLQRELDALKERKLENIQKRKRVLKGGKVVCICGFYNAGKTTLFNALTGLQKPVSDQPFTTLSSKYARSLMDNSNLMLVDTIGFVLDLKISLIKSFELNVIDMLNADRVLFLLSLEDEKRILELKLQYGLKTLLQLGIAQENILLVFNKIDLMQKSYSLAEKLEEIKSLNLNLPWITISAKEERNLLELVRLIRSEDINK